MRDTKLLSNNEEDLKISAEFLKNGEIVGMPTETVYGLAADACNPEAVAKIFEAKGRPSDNPLIVHIADIKKLSEIAYNIPDLAYRLAEAFWPGPLTMILPKKDCIPSITSGGLDTVGVRMPSHIVARKMISYSGLSIAAPSGNISGYPSPTKASHMMRDMYGKIPAVVDGGTCSVGVESTVISFENDNTVRILRPGYITKEDLQKIADNVIIDSAILEKLSDGQIVRSPGMKYKHYSPSADVILVDSNYEDFCCYVNNHSRENTYALVFNGEGDNLFVPFFAYGADGAEQAHEIFSLLRKLDDISAGTVYVRTPSKDGVGLAVYNRLIRAAGFEVIKL